MKKPLVASLAMAVAMACSPLVMAGTTTTTTSSTTTSQHAKWQGHRHGHHGMRMLDKLNLSATQKTSVQQLMQQDFEQAKPALQSLRQQRMAFENATPGSADYQADANNLAQAESNAAHDRVLREADMRSKIYNILTPEQRTQLASLRAEHQQKMQQRREEWMQKHNAKSTTTTSRSSTTTTPAGSVQ